MTDRRLKIWLKKKMTKPVSQLLDTQKGRVWLAHWLAARIYADWNHLVLSGNDLLMKLDRGEKNRNGER